MQTLKSTDGPRVLVEYGEGNFSPQPARNKRNRGVVQALHLEAIQEGGALKAVCGLGTRIRVRLWNRSAPKIRANHKPARRIHTDIVGM